MHEHTNKQHLLAEDSPAHEMIPSLCDLVHIHYPSCIALAAFSSKDKRMMSYKIALPVTNITEVEPWFKENFNKITEVVTHTEYEVTPALFNSETFTDSKLSGQVSVNRTNALPNTLHLVSALIDYHLIDKKAKQIYLFKNSTHYHILLMDGATCYLANTFKCDNNHEILYFLLNTIQISDLLPSETTLNIDYSIAEDQVLVDFIKPHFAFFNLLSAPGIIHHPVVPMLGEKLFGCYAAALCV
ncbi:MAG: DUF3822 family protein [Bacteroidota bacterium]